MRSASCQRKADDRFFPELLVIKIRYNLFLFSILILFTKIRDGIRLVSPSLSAGPHAHSVTFIRLWNLVHMLLRVLRSS
jgi:hypothetical protein